MSLITEQIKTLKEHADYMEEIGHLFTASIIRHAAETIEALSEKVRVANMERSTAYYNGGWIPVKVRLPKTDNKNEINSFNVLLWVKNKTHPERKPQIYLGKLKDVKGDDGSGNFWGIETKPCEWTIWGWSYFNEPEVIAWQPLPEPYREDGDTE